MDDDHEKKGFRLESVTIGWTMTAAIAALATGTVAGSIALIGFGLHGLTDSVSAALFLRQLRREKGGREHEEVSGVGGSKSLFAVGVAFFLLALYLLHESGSRLFYGERPATSVEGLFLAVMSLVIMVILLIMNVRTRTALDPRMLRYRTRRTAVRIFLAAVLLLGLGLHLRLGWWWADPAAVFLMLPTIVLEGWEASVPEAPGGLGALLSSSLLFELSFLKPDGRAVAASILPA